MPVLQQQGDGAGHFLRSEDDDRVVIHDLRPEGAMILLNVYGIKIGGYVDPETLDKLLGMNLAGLRPEPPKPAPVPPPSLAPPAIPTTQPAPPKIVAKPSGIVRPSLVRRSEARVQDAATAPKSTATAARPVPIQEARPHAVRNLRRSRCREVALQVLYQLEQNPGLSPQAIDRFLKKRLVDDKLCDFGRSLVVGVKANGPAIDAMITEVAENWRIDRMAAIDRNILRLGAFEMLFGTDVPAKVAINEALEIAKRYSTAQSSRFVNGILDRMLTSDKARKAATLTLKEVSVETPDDPPSLPEVET